MFGIFNENNLILYITNLSKKFGLFLLRVLSLSYCRLYVDRHNLLVKWNAEISNDTYFFFTKDLNNSMFPQNNYIYVKEIRQRLLKAQYFVAITLMVFALSFFLSRREC